MVFVDNSEERTSFDVLSPSARHGTKNEQKILFRLFQFVESSLSVETNFRLSIFDFIRRDQFYSWIVVVVTSFGAILFCKFNSLEQFNWIHFDICFGTTRSRWSRWTKSTKYNNKKCKMNWNKERSNANYRVKTECTQLVLAATLLCY